MNYHKELLAFGKSIIKICNSINITPIVYGGLAYFYHTNDKKVVVNDLDLLVPESAFTDLIKLLDKQENLRYEKMPYHSIEVFSDDLEIDLDSIEHYLDPRSRENIEVDINGALFNILNIDSLIDVYQEALDNVPDIKELDDKRKKYTIKLTNLKKQNQKIKN